MVILNGRKIAERILKKLKKKIREKKLKLKLIVIQVGNNKVSNIYIRNKKNACDKIGVAFQLKKFPLGISREKFKKEIMKSVKEKGRTSIIIQLPLPQRLDSLETFDLIPVEKDLDCLNSKNFGKMPPTAEAIIYLLKRYRIKIKNKRVVVVGSGRLVGQPISLWLLEQGAILSIINKFTKKPFLYTRKADILISAVGKPNLIKGEMVKKGVVAVDAGTTFKNSRLVGDIDFESVKRKAAYLTPVPAGVGPLTVACLLENLVNNYVT